LIAQVGWHEVVAEGYMMNRQELVDAIVRSGGAQHVLDETDALFGRLSYLQDTKRYGKLLSQLANANDRNNFLALVLEANFAYQFESQGLNLTYEVKQNAQHGSSIDFLRSTSGGDKVFFELRLLQRAKSDVDSITEQLSKGKTYFMSINADYEQDAVVRIQNTILGKVQGENGSPIKFFDTTAGVVNLVVIDTSAGILPIDLRDCMLATGGDPSVEEIYRRKIFGLFQEDNPEYPQHIHVLAEKYAHVRKTLHGVLFLFKRRDTGMLAYDLEQYLLWNPALIDTKRASSILDDVASAIPIRK
jgi:hypothetical protein